MMEGARNVTADLLAKGLFSRYLECPICGSTDRIHTDTPFQSNGYIAAAARGLGLSEKDLVDSMEGQKCLACGALYFDPWLSGSFQRELYEELSPQHNMGWEIFWSIIKNPLERPRDAVLCEMIREKIPTLNTYAEVGCPFIGLIPYISLREYQYGSRTFMDYPGTYTIKSFIGAHPRVGGVLNLERLGSYLARFFNRLQLLRAFSFKRLIKRSLIRFGQAREIRRHGPDCYYIRHSSNLLWGKNCKSLGVDCPTALKNVFGARIISFEDLQTENVRFDLVGIFNSLDHYKNPIGLLHQLFQFTDYIYLEGHCAGADWGKQHLYFFEKETFTALPRLLPLGEAMGDFEGRPSQHCYSILLRKKNGHQAKEQLVASL